VYRVGNDRSGQQARLVTNKDLEHRGRSRFMQ
jgi:hypothetical protein